jgi:hypothetical protein
MERGELGSHSDIPTLPFPLIFVVLAKIYLQLYQNGIPTLPFLLMFVVFAKIYLQLYQNGIRFIYRYLNVNNITKIDADLFTGLTNLTQL